MNEKDAKEFIDWVDAWVSNPVTAYSVSALDGLFQATRAKIASLRQPQAMTSNATLTPPPPARAGERTVTEQSGGKAVTDLTGKRRRILRCLDRHRGCPVTVREIGRYCGEDRRDWAHGALRGMHSEGLVRAAGTSFTNAKTWSITEAGRRALGVSMEGGE